MNPIDTYANTSTRARTLLLYHDGLVNTRARSIRSDWKSSFLKLMHWPATHNIERIDGKDAVVILRNGASLAPANFTPSSLDDMLRASLTFGVSALDRYVHERVIRGFVRALKLSFLTKQQEDFSIPVTTAIQISVDALNAHKAKKNVRTANIVRKKVQQLLHKKPFQSWREIEYAFNLLGVTTLTTQLQMAYGISDIKPIRMQLNQIAGRRNSIVHEGDLERHERGGTVKMLPIARKFVEDSLDFLDMFVIHLENVS